MNLKFHAAARFTMFLLGLYVWSCASAQQPFVVEGKLEGIPDGASLLLTKLQGNLNVRVDCDTLHDGRFRLEGMAAATEMFTVRLSDELLVANALQLWGQGGDTVTVKGVGRCGFEWQVMSSNPMQAEETAYVRGVEEEYRRMNKYLAMHDELEKHMQQMPENRKQALEDSLANLSKEANRANSRATVKQFAMLKQRYLKDGKVKPLSPCAEFRFLNVAAEAVWGDGVLDADEVRAFYKLIPESRRQSYAMQYAGVLLFPPEVVKQGDRMYDGAVLYDLQGGEHRLSDYNEGKYLMLDFWSSGCGPCLQSFPELKAVSEELKDSLVVISISSDLEKEWQKASARHDITWANLNDKRGSIGIFSHYGIYAFPSYVIVSPEGKIVKTFTGYSEGRIKQKLSSIFPQYK